jgi:chemotaxis protein MotB
MVRRRQKKVEEGAPGWMMTFGDLMSQLLTFFVLLVSFSIFDEIKYNTVKGSLKYSFGVLKGWEQPLVEKIRTPPETSRTNNEEQKLAGIGYRLKKFVAEKGMKGSLQAVMRKEGLAIILRNSGKPVMFDSGSAQIRPEFAPILEKVAKELMKIPNRIRIEGHTDNRPISTLKFPSNWELSAARAASVLRFLVRKGIDPARLSAVGYGEFRPVAPNDTPEGRAKNRRVEILVLKETPSQR